MKRLCWSILVFVQGVWGADIQPAASAQGISYGNMLNALFSLLLVLGIFFACAWVIRKTGRIYGLGRNNLRVVTGVSLGMREKVVLLQVGEKQLLLGVSPGRINKLLELEGDQRLLAEEDKSGSDFAGKLKEVIKRQSDD